MVRKVKNSFDVACEWSKGFVARMSELPRSLREQLPEADWVWVVPKFHVAAHKESCQANYSPNYVVHLGRWDGESVERNWAKLNAGAASTKEMTPGSRWETLDDFCGFSNWCKTIQLGMVSIFRSSINVYVDMRHAGDDLLRLLLEAIPAYAEHQADFDAFDKHLRSQCPGDVKEWEEMLSAWVNDRRAPSPYLPPKKSTYEHEPASSEKMLIYRSQPSRARTSVSGIWKGRTISWLRHTASSKKSAPAASSSSR